MRAAFGSPVGAWVGACGLRLASGCMGACGLRLASGCVGGWILQSTAPDKVHETMNEGPARSSTCEPAPHACLLHGPTRKVSSGQQRLGLFYPPPPPFAFFFIFFFVTICPPLSPLLTVYPNSKPNKVHPVCPLKSVVKSQPPLGSVCPSDPRRRPTLPPLLFTRPPTPSHPSYGSKCLPLKVPPAQRASRSIRCLLTGPLACN